MNALDLAKDWLRYAKSDLIAARHMFENIFPKEIEIACYHCQQCAEKALKSYCISKGIEPPKTHDLVTLCHLCIAMNNSFSSLLNKCSRLNPYGVAARYPNELAVDDAITELAINKAQVIYDFCAEKILEMDTGGASVEMPTDGDSGG
ncbi:MAG: HEPN domain-containing protein [Treponema sp.]|nr:HEPN domain-containing protein [Treponema sp.]